MQLMIEYFTSIQICNCKNSLKTASINADIPRTIRRGVSGRTNASMSTGAAVTYKKHYHNAYMDR